MRTYNNCITKKRKIMKAQNNISNKMKSVMGSMFNGLKLKLYVLLIFISYQAFTGIAFGQTGGGNDIDKIRFNRFSLGLRLTHLYDMKYTSYDLLTSGYSASDPSGLNGPKTKFDMATGLDMSYFFGPMFSMDLGYEKGKMTGANLTEYYSSDVSFITVGGNVSLKRSGRTRDYRFVPYFRGSVAYATYDSERKFISDNGSLTDGKPMTGNTYIVGLGLGFRYHLSNKWHLNLMSEFCSIHTDAWDGYDYGSGEDQMMKTTVGIRYSFGPDKHVDRVPGWQDRRVDRIQSKVDEQMDRAIKSMNDSVANMMKKMTDAPENKDSDKDGIADAYDKCPETAGVFANNGCPEKVIETVAVKEINEAVAHSPATQSLSEDEKKRIKNELIVEMSAIRFSYNSSTLTTKSLEQLNATAVVLRNNPAYKIEIKGFTDDAGSDEYNMALSQKRADAVAGYLTSRGIAGDRIKILPMGKSAPLDDNTSRIGKSNNRRVELKLVF